MLPELYRQRYQEFWQALQRLTAIATQQNPDAQTLQEQFLAVQQFFQVQLVSLALEGLNPAQAAQVQSYQTEINKQLRLLGMDVMFLQAARRSATAQQRQAQMQERIGLLGKYCDALLEENNA